MEGQDRSTAQGAWSLAIGAQIQTTVRKVHQTFYPSLNSDPGNDSTAPLLPSSYHGYDAMDAQQKDQRSPGTGSTVMALVKLLVVMMPLITVFSSWAILLGAGLDPLAFGMLAFYLVMTLCGVIMLIAQVQLMMAKRQRAKDRQHGAIIEEPIFQAPKDWKHVLYVTLTILAVYILFYAVIWMWGTITDDGNDKGLPSPWHIFVVSRKLQAKLGGPSSIENLGNCLQEAIPHRHATIADVSRCLRIMGMKPFHDGF